MKYVFSRPIVMTSLRSPRTPIVSSTREMIGTASNKPKNGYKLYGKQMWSEIKL